jgi:hypothetical protein
MTFTEQISQETADDRTENRTSRTRPVLLTILLPMRPTSKPSTIQATKDVTEPRGRSVMSILRVVRSTADIAFALLLKSCQVF